MIITIIIIVILDLHKYQFLGKWLVLLQTLKCYYSDALTYCHKVRIKSRVEA